MALKCHVKVTDFRRSNFSHRGVQGSESRTTDQVPRSVTDSPSSIRSCATELDDVINADDSTNACPSSHQYVVTIPSPMSTPINGNTPHFHTMSKFSILQQIKDELTNRHGYDSDIQQCVFKFKNIRGSHIPLNMATVQNSSSRTPMLVEIYNRKQSVEAITLNGKAVVTPMHPDRVCERNFVARNVCRQLNARLSKLEEAIARGPPQQKLFIETQVGELARRVDRLECKVNAMSLKEWQGMIRRNPLW